MVLVVSSNRKIMEIEEKRRKHREYMRKYYHKNRKKILKYYKRPEVRKRIREYKKEYRKDPLVKLKRKELTKRYYSRPEIHIKKIKYDREYYKMNKPKIREWKRLYFKRLRRGDKSFYIQCLLKRRLHHALTRYTKRGKVTTADEYGVNYKAIIEHLKPFPEEMKKYHIDHIRPLCSFNLENPKEIKQAFAPDNHQWLTVEENLSKGGTYEF